MSHKERGLEKEFELERLVLFSDAVFAIAITLLIIEIKFPEVPKGIHGMALLQVFKPAIIEFITFVVSFVIIGVYWVRHLELCRFLRGYDKKMIAYNLVFLFFVVCFPFTASGIGHFTPSFHIPMHLYMINLLCLTVSFYAMLHYVLVTKPSLSFAGREPEKKYFLLQVKLLGYMLAVSLLVVMTVFFLTDEDNSIYRVLSYQSLSVFAIIMVFLLKKHRPHKSLPPRTNEPETTLLP